MQALADMSDVERKLSPGAIQATCASLAKWPGATIRIQVLKRFVPNAPALGGGYKREGLAGLVRKSRMDSGERRTVTPRLCEAIEGLALEKPPLPLTSVHRQAKQFAHLVGEPAPSYWVVRDIVLSLPNDLRTLAQQGTRRFGEWTFSCSGWDGLDVAKNLFEFHRALYGFRTH